MGKGVPAFANLPQIDVVLPGTNGATSIEALKALMKIIVQLQSEAPGNGTYNGLKGYGADPYFTAEWNIVISAGTTYTCTFVSEDNPEGGAQGRAALTTRRKIDLTKLTSANLANVRSLSAVINYIDKLEDGVAKTGSATFGDVTNDVRSLRGNTPFESFEWDITKASAAYTIATTANS